MSGQYFTYRDLRVYQHAKDFVVFVYSLLKQFPKEENYALCDQLRSTSARKGIQPASLSSSFTLYIKA